MPCFRDTDNLVYGKAESGGVLFGGYEPDPPARWVDGAPWEHGGRALPADQERFAPLHGRRRPALPVPADAGVAALVCHPDAMTPDGNPLLGPMPGVPGFWMAAGLSLNGFGGAGGIGKAMAEWITTARPRSTSCRYRAWRFGRHLPRCRLRRRGRARGLPLLLPAALPARRRQWARPQRRWPAARAAAGARRGVRRRRTAGSAPTTSSPVSRGGGPAPTSARSAGWRRPTSTGSEPSTRHSVSASASST